MGSWPYKSEVFPCWLVGIQTIPSPVWASETDLPSFRWFFPCSQVFLLKHGQRSTQRQRSPYRSVEFSLCRSLLPDTLAHKFFPPWLPWPLGVSSTWGPGSSCSGYLSLYWVVSSWLAGVIVGFLLFEKQPKTDPLEINVWKPLIHSVQFSSLRQRINLVPVISS